VNWKWTPPFSLMGIFRRDDLWAKFGPLFETSVDWRPARMADWPDGYLNSDHRFARKGGFGWVTAVGDEKLFLVPRGWLEPEWGLSSFTDGRWTHLGSFEPLPKSWKVPALAGEGFV
jgi:hypothetical protein